MELTVFNEKAEETKQINFTGNSVKELLHYLNVNPETVLVIREEEVITEEETLQENDCLELLSVISGG